jgi:hypothetical protein
MRLLLLALSLLSFACAQSEPKQQAPQETRKPAAAAPSLEAARDLINTSGEFSEYEFTHAAYTLPMSKAARNAESEKAAADLRGAGWIRLDGSGNVVLTQKAKDDKRWLVRANGVVDLVPLGRKEVDRVTAIRQLPSGKVEADFQWHWVTNEVGSAFRSGPAHDRYAAKDLPAVATLSNDGPSWNVDRIVAR